jgi:hypothetical protein
LIRQLADIALWVLAIPVGLVPRRFWPSLDALPLRRAAAMSGIVTMLTGFFVGFGGFLTFAGVLAGANNDWMLHRLAGPPAAGDAAVGLVPYGMSVLTVFIFLFFTPLGLASLYVATSGFLRATAAWLDDPSGDFILTAIDWAAVRLFEKNRAERRQLARERLEGADAPDVLQTGAWAGLPDDDYVVLAARVKPEWDAGAIVMTGDDWYKLGVPFDLQTPVGMRTAYPLKKMDTVEVVRRGIHYQLPRLRGKPTPQSTHS